MKIRLYYTRKNELKFISHLNTLDLLQRAVFHTDAQVAFSEGFNPHPKMSFGNPLPLGVSSDFEIFDVELVNDIDIDKFVQQLNNFLPKEIQVFKAFEASEKSISKIFSHSIYEFIIDSQLSLDSINIFDEKVVIIKRKKKSKNKKIVEYIEEDITQNIEFLSNFEKISDNEYKLVAKLENSAEKIINPMNFITGIFEKYDLDVDIYDVSIHKREML